MADSDSSRKHPRTEVILKVDYDSPEDFLADYASNASDGGVFIATQRTFKDGEALSFSISFPGLVSAIRCKGRVRWSRPESQASQDSPAGIGVAFTFDSDQEAERIRELVKSLTMPVTITDTPPESAGVDSSPFRVLLVEDNNEVREMFRFGLQKFHGVRMSSHRALEVVEATDGRQAWDLIQAQDFDLAIIDLKIPIMSGEEIIRAIRKEEKTRALPVITASAGGDEAKKSAYAAGADLFLTKPVMLVQFFNSLHRLLGLGRPADDEDKTLV
jgi:uncharacterized protein (TIGR02266 family)